MKDTNEEIREIRRRAGIVNESILHVLLGVLKQYADLVEIKGEPEARQWLVQKGMNEEQIVSMQEAYRKLIRSAPKQ